MSRHSSSKLRALVLGSSALCLSAGLAAADQQIFDDLIVIGSICAGQDCSNGESFGFDTLRLKENNLRIRAFDTSNSASFPTRDWQITFNDSSNGGQNKFSIDDIDGGRTPFTIEAGAPSHSLYVDDSGRLGFGTSTPVVELHLTDGDTPTLRLEQDGTSGFTPQTWDVAGNEAGFFVRDVTGGSKLSLRIRPGAPASSIDIAADGDVGVGTDSPAARMHVRTTANLGLSDSHLRVTNASGTEAARTMLTLENNGVAVVALSDTSGVTPLAWNIQARGANSGEEFRITNGANAGEEFTLSKTGDLSITGTLTVNSGGAGQTFPDYVFEPDYALMPLSEVQAFIRENGHLPKIPNAAEVAENGINMTELQISLLEKVEELTLYTLDQHETIAALTARIGQLERQLDN